MESLFMWIGTGFGALLVVAIAVAWWEHLQRTERHEALADGGPQRAVSIDVRLDTLAEAPGEAGARQAVLDDTLGRAAQASSHTSARSWPETRPMTMIQAATKPAAKPAADPATTPQP